MTYMYVDPSRKYPVSVESNADILAIQQTGCVEVSVDWRCSRPSSQKNVLLPVLTTHKEVVRSVSLFNTKLK